MVELYFIDFEVGNCDLFPCNFRYECPVFFFTPHDAVEFILYSFLPSSCCE